jgi:regulator of sigma E protease
MILTVLIFLIILSLLVLIHEWGHFIVARFFDIKVEEFGFGLPPKAFGIKKGETVYSINWLPIGGFVKLYGEDEAGAGRITGGKQQAVSSKDEKRAFFAKNPWKRAAVVVAGVVMNTLLAILIFYIYLGITNYKTEFPLLNEHKFVFTNQTNVNLNEKDAYVTYVSPDSPAEKAGILPHAKILSVNGQPIVSRNTFIDTVNSKKGQELSITWEDIRSNEVVTTKVVPRAKPPEGQGPLGVAFLPTAILSYNTPAERIFSGITHPYNILSYTIDVMAKLIAVSFEKHTAEPVSQGVSGPVGIYSLLGSILQIPDFKEKLLQVLNLAGLLSISLAFFNVLPIPALDGGRLFFILIEAVTGKKVPERFETMAHTIGMTVLLALIALITLRDFWRLFTGHL